MLMFLGGAAALGVAFLLVMTSVFMNMDSSGAGGVPAMLGLLSAGIGIGMMMTALVNPFLTRWRWRRIVESPEDD